MKAEWQGVARSQQTKAQRASVAMNDRRQAVLAADDLQLGSPEVRTAEERDAHTPADRSCDAFRAFGFDDDDSVLVLGATDGAIARLLAAQVRSVVVAATGTGAEVVAARCRSLSNVSVQSSLADVATSAAPFNAILSPLGPLDPDQLATLAPVIDDTTMVVWAEHNPFGFDRMLGESTAAELVASHTLADQQDAHDALADVGLRLRSTLYPYPTLSAPAMLLAPPLFRHDNKTEVFDLVSAHESAMPGRATAAPDALRALLLAGAARSLMPSRIVIASRVALPSERFDCGVAAWTFERHADPVWCSMHRFVSTDRTESSAPDAAPAVVQFAERLFPERGRAERGWLSMAVVDEADVRLRAPMHTELHRAAVRGDVEHIGTMLKQWRSALRSHELDPSDDHSATNPFAPAPSESRLSPEWFDARLGNVALETDVADSEPGLRLFSQRFRLSGPVATDMVLARSYWYLARDLVAARLPHPWSAAISVDELAQTLASHGGDSIGPAQLDRWRQAEADLFAIVSGGERSAHLERLTTDGRSDAAALAANSAGADLRAEVARLRAERATSIAEAQALQSRLGDLEQLLAAAVAGEAGEIEDLRHEVADLRSERDRQADKVDAQSRLLTEVIRKYERAVHERNMVEQGMQSYRRVVTIAKRVMPTDVYFRVRKIVRGH